MNRGALLRLIPILPFLLFSCGQSSPSAALAREFMEAYYVKADLGVASKLAGGLALEKIQSSEKLREGLGPDASVEANRRRLSFKLIEEKVEGASATYLYRVEIKPQGGDPIRKKTLLRVRQSAEGGWKVTQFADLEDEGP